MAKKKVAKKVPAKKAAKPAPKKATKKAAKKPGAKSKQNYLVIDSYPDTTKTKSKAALAKAEDALAKKLIAYIEAHPKAKEIELRIGRSTVGVATKTGDGWDVYLKE